MFKKFYPYEYVESVFEIDFNKLYERGYRGIMFDIDNTLVPHGEDSTQKVDDFFRELNSIGFKTLLLTNNNKERTERFNKNIGTLYICDGDKPKPDNYLKGLEMLNLKKDEVVFIGDTIFTDIVGANRSRIDNILVKFIGYDTETKIGIKRNIEKVILKFYSLNKKCQNRIGNIQK